VVRADPHKIPDAFNEVVRLESPIRGFTRSVTEDTTVAGYRIPKDARVLVLFASANRDERQWDRPDEFDVTRDAGGHVGFGHGVHGCAGQGLARMEGQAVLRALAGRVQSSSWANLSA
jgi:cytochrome P450